MKIFNRLPRQLSLLPSSPAERCACGTEKMGRLIVCGDCWERVPVPVRHLVQYGDKPSKRAAARAILGFARARKMDKHVEFYAVKERGAHLEHTRD